MSLSGAIDEYYTLPELAQLKNIMAVTYLRKWLTL